MNLYDLVLQQYENTLNTANFHPDVINLMKFPMNEIIVHYPIRKDDGSVEIIKGYRFNIIILWVLLKEELDLVMISI